MCVCVCADDVKFFRSYFGRTHHPLKIIVSSVVSTTRVINRTIAAFNFRVDVLVSACSKNKYKYLEKFEFFFFKRLEPRVTHYLLISKSVPTYLPCTLKTLVRGIFVPYLTRSL